ncbi:MAG: DUF805 domain-containing protein [Akkermansiaceae bacterium]
MNKEWYFTDDSNQQAGPISREELGEKIAQGVITPNTLVWSQGMQNWSPVSTVPGLIPALTSTKSAASVSSLSQETNPYTTPQANLFTEKSSATDATLKSRLFSFQGRIPRRVYWGYNLMIGLFYGFFIMVTTFIFGEESPVSIALSLILYVPLVWISFAISVKRWHDRDKSAWWICIGFIPIVGGIWAFIECGCLRGTVGSNNYGLDPT